MKTKVIYRKDIMKKIGKLGIKIDKLKKKEKKAYARYIKAKEKYEKNRHSTWFVSQKLSGLYGHLNSMNWKGSNLLTVKK